jgi:hypothetical protein
MWHFRGSYVTCVWLHAGNRFGTLKEEAQESIAIRNDDWRKRFA